MASRKLKSRAWYVLFPRDAYALGPYRFVEPVCERELRVYVRKHMGYPRLPNGTHCWRTDD